jgi:hypothetical protein
MVTVELYFAFMQADLLGNHRIPMYVGGVSIQFRDTMLTVA